MIAPSVTPGAMADTRRTFAFMHAWLVSTIIQTMECVSCLIEWLRWSCDSLDISCYTSDIFIRSCIWTWWPGSRCLVSRTAWLILLYLITILASSGYENKIINIRLLFSHFSKFHICYCKIKVLSVADSSQSLFTWLFLNFMQWAVFPYWAGIK